MKKKFERVYQFKVTLKDTKPPVWRRIQVPETYSFWDLHVAIQDSMGWSDYHLHEFLVGNPSIGLVNIGIPDEDFLEAIKDPNHEEHKEMLEWIGGKFDPGRFDANKVVFDNPDKRRKIAFG